MCPFGRKETTPSRAKDGGALPRERLLGQRLCSVPYQPWGEGVRREDWNVNALVFDFVTFLLRRVSAPFLFLRMCTNSPVVAFPFRTPAGDAGVEAGRALCVR